MSTYKGHSVFALIVSIMFFHSPLLIALTLIGANIPDFDHKFKKDNVYKLIILGLIVFISLYILKLPYYIGLIIVFLGVTFNFSEHRSFTHSIFGVLTLTAAVSLILIWSFQLIVAVTDINDYYLIMAILTVLISFLFLNKNVLMLFLPVFFISLFVFKTGNVNCLEIVLSLFLGVFSHVVLDSFTPAGIKIFAPLSSKKVYRNFGIISIFVLVVLAIVYRAPILFELFEQYVSNSLLILGI
ncbi:metal-dependent hydrolase [uncultured Methanobrevibacter sp.]|uniref:metal-dependent hydrolase n=1 Tax=uncultured Methanobrevibacter sp. TaxID=253161 RepID=UPI00262F6B8D|nr:metal-dependent hydrolase [uncultured Methanobrevibacter sp.]